MVMPYDHVIVLGDLMLNNDERGLYLLKQLKGTIHVIRGNHDSDSRVAKYCNCYNVNNTVIPYADVLEYDGYKFYLSHYPTLCGNYDGDKPLSRRTINLCGHLHTPDRWCDWNKGLIYHVELDAHDNTPVALDDIIKDIQEKIKG